MSDDSKDLRVLFPGTVVDLPEGFSVTVYPLAFKQIKEFADKVASGIAMLTATSVPKASAGATPKQKTQVEKVQNDMLIQTLLPWVLSNAVDLVEKCVVFPKDIDIKLQDLPHYRLPPIIEAWVEESFIGEDKLRPWMAVVEHLTEKVTGKKIVVSEILSKAVSSRATAAAT